VEVLLVEDNEGDVFLVRQALDNHPVPINLHVVNDGKQAVQLLAARRFHPDLVILDLNVPKISGLSVLECSESGVPIVVFTSSNSPQDRQCAFELGAKEFVQKPIDPDAYSAAVLQIVRTWTGSAADSFSA
jgi:chemotaxis family two-component system response regulator Rcp1